MVNYGMDPLEGKVISFNQDGTSMDSTSNHWEEQASPTSRGKKSPQSRKYCHKLHWQKSHNIFPGNCSFLNTTAAKLQ
ncbi:uncharacterized protein DS421_8g248060 [Arachis hypogaea]|nr:uncharacterized protein DS421_8g248060 [Arachis hypogaea]